MGFQRTATNRRLVGLALSGAFVMAGCGSSSDGIRIEASVGDEGIAFDDTGLGLLGTFTADGEGICRQGTWTNAVSDHDDVSAPFSYRDQYNCADGSGNFFVNVEATADRAEGSEPYDGTWTIDGDGLGDYSNMTGSGTLRAVVGSERVETYEGSLD